MRCAERSVLLCCGGTTVATRRTKSQARSLAFACQLLKLTWFVVYTVLNNENCTNYSSLLLRRPMPAAAAPLLAHTLALANSSSSSNNNNSSSSSTIEQSAAVAAEPLLLQALQSVGREWFEPLFVHSTPPQQLEYITAFILAALSR